jgi:hypothetical protein
VAILENGGFTPATNVQIIGDGTVARVTFGGLAAQNSDEGVVRIVEQGRHSGAGAGCVRDRNLTTNTSSTGHAAVQSRTGQGFSSGPDLTGCTLNPGANQATFPFDERVASGASPTPANFGLLDAAGGRTNGTSISAVSENLVVVNFPNGAFATAQGCTINPNTIVDRDPGPSGPDGNPLNTVQANSSGGTATTGTPSGTTGTPTTGTPSTTTGTPSTTTGTPSTTTGTGGTSTTTGGVNTQGRTVPGVNGVPKRSVSSFTPASKCLKVNNGRTSCLVTGRIPVPGGSVISRSEAKSAQTLTFPLRLCSGRVRLTVKRGSRTLVSRLATVGRTCRWSKRFVIPSSRLPRGLRRKGVRVVVTLKSRYGGNRYLKAKNGRTKRIAFR